MSTLDLEGLKALLEKAHKHVALPIWRDSTESEGSYGAGPDARTGYKVSRILDDKGRFILDIDSYEIGLIEEEFDEDGCVAWDTASYDVAKAIVALVNAAPALIAAEERAQRAEGENARLGIALETARMQRDSRRMDCEHQGKMRQTAEAERDALKEAMRILRSLLCDPDGRCVIAGSDADRHLIEHALGGSNAP